ncbi:urease accessory protein UreF [Paenibacillus sp. FSL W8-0186]|uniref:Urease accessory protein UreF n=1 Tax=Paenibacillus woosongensis TaxID=307580 RepID=A0ABQ4MSE9_9BACL|nr:urease accessory protein UreF [Paenibacillus woosongensis]GIP58925.1 urease accessory protein UreF [Paenibacillus woosongensis]
MADILPLLQICDSNFPNGAFSHSFGLETYVQEGKVVDKPTFAEWISAYIAEQLVYTDGLAFRLVYEALDRAEQEHVWAWDRMITVQSFPQETRDGSARMGQRLVQLGLELYDSPVLAAYQKRLKAQQSFGHPAIAFAIIAQYLHVPLPVALLAYLHSCTASLIQNGVRGIPLGQTDGQRLIQDMHAQLRQAVKKIEALDEDEFGATSPGLELSQMRHEQLHIRLFMS